MERITNLKIQLPCLTGAVVISSIFLDSKNFNCLVFNQLYIFKISTISIISK